jgi:acyl-CoA thioester hydrolase
MNDSAPIIHTSEIQPEWLDYNNHLNVAFYVLIFDQSGEALMQSIGLGEGVTRETGFSWVALENHVTFDREVTLGQTVDVRIQLLDHDAKRLHIYLEMHVRGANGYLAATQEQMLMCIDLRQRRSAPFPKEVQASIEAMARQHAQMAPPANIGRKIGIRR